VDLGIRIQAVGRRHRDLLSAMYDGFDPLGAALGLPPPATETRRSWIGRALGQKWNLAAFSPEGRILGHCFLAADDRTSAEVAVFVHQESRGKGIGAALVKAALSWAAAAGVRRVWSVTPSDNRIAMRLQRSLGFHMTRMSSETEMEICLPAAARISHCAACR
jgi:GNAT superfamily N-acetyltransferase